MFALFAGSAYYPSGGWNDFKGTFDSITEAEDRFYRGESYGTEKTHIFYWDWGHVVDLSTHTVVRRITD